jgi:hypothetical protein
MSLRGRETPLNLIIFLKMPVFVGIGSGKYPEKYRDAMLKQFLNL